MGGLASAPGIRNIGDFINLSTPGGVLFVGALGDFQEDVATLSWDTANHFLTVNGIKVGLSVQAPVDVSGTVVGLLAAGPGGAAPASGFNVTAVGAGAAQGIGPASTDITAIGYAALNTANNAANNCTAVGSKALQNNGNHVRNTAIGSNAGRQVNGNDNIAIGYNVLTAGTVHSNSTIIGNNSCSSLTGTATNGVVVGQNAAGAAHAVVNSVLLGQQAGGTSAGGIGTCVAVGASALNTAGDMNGRIAIGYNVQVGGDNGIAIGTAAGSVTVGANQIEIGNAVHIQTTLHGNLIVAGGSVTTADATAMVKTSVALNNGAGAAVGTLNTAPVAGNPTKWVPINDNGTTRFIPAW